MNKIFIAVVLVICCGVFFLLFKHVKEQALLKERTVSTENALQAWNKQAMFIDVRTVEEYQQGHAPGAVLIPLHELAQRSGEIPQDRDIFLICRSGNRSGKAVLSLVDRGYRNVYNVDGGMMSWKGPIATNN